MAPNKLSPDTILESVCEVRFDSVESEKLPEVVIGKLALLPPWSEYDSNRLPISDLPAELRKADQNLKYQPHIELTDGEKSTIIRIGTNNFSVGRLGSYPGWDAFFPQIKSAFEAVSTSLSKFSATRLGLRYINSFSQSEHGVGSIEDLNCLFSVGDDNLSAPLNVNYQKTFGPDHIIQVRLATPEYVSGPRKQPGGIVADIDVSTPNNWKCEDLEKVIEWIEIAHQSEKSEFFKLFTEEMKSRLVIE
ncbi:TIGR04255 family protein [Hyphomonas jannaschiana]|uniref:TIGR04255 family protein n=1 Tax=Hyphomonas jannaschiana VP2 TaxID=1280952 RepID=A0A059FDB3_9PROT|nr:TIGR04255 family protein [Hyphomonas jannaschiana]KCZ88614.1 hypothetical protein HJA_09604 [Hyphomonas jannaschiana VP2]